MLRLLSTCDDYFSWFVTLLPLATGMALLPAPAGPIPLAIHLLSLAGADFARRGAAL